MCNAAVSSIHVTDIHEYGPSLVIFVGADKFYVLRFFFCWVLSQTLIFSHVGTEPLLLCITSTSWGGGGG